MNKYQYPHVNKLSELTGCDIRNSDGDELGKLQEIVISLNDGKISYGILSFGKLFGVGGKLFAVPWHLLNLNPDGDGLLLDLPVLALKDAPGFDETRLPDWSDPSVGNEVGEYYRRLGTSWGNSKL